MNYLDRVDLFAGLDEAQMQSLVDRSRLRSFVASTVVVNEGDEGGSMYVVQSGSLKAYLTDKTGREVTLSLLDEGDYFGELALLDDAPRSASVAAVTRSELLQVPRSAFLALIEEHPASMQVVVRNLVARIRALSDNVRSLALEDVFRRVTRAFETLAVERDGRRLIERRLTQQDVASLVGASREMINRVLRELVAGGYVEIEQHHIVLRRKLPT